MGITIQVLGEDSSVLQRIRALLLCVIAIDFDLSDTRNVKTLFSPTLIVLSLVSFLTDVSSEMIFPLLPAFLTVTLGASPLALGLIEGIGEATSSLLKFFSGAWSDQKTEKKSLILFGYGLSGFMRPWIGFSTAWTHVLTIRFVDRIGKGIRTAPRDAMLASSVDESHRGQAYGIHRAMDHAGALTGPLIATLLISHFNFLPREVFFCSALPAALAFFTLLLGLKDSPQPAVSPPTRSPNPWKGWRELSPSFWRMFFAVALFSLGNSADSFIILRLTQSGVPLGSIAGLWALHNAIKMISTAIGGKAADLLGPRKMILMGWGYFAVMYLLLGHFESREILVPLFLAYGCYYGMVEPAERSLVAGFAPPHLRGTAFGLFHFAVGIAALPASLLFGALWTHFGAQAAFGSGAILTGLAALLLAGETLGRNGRTARFD